MGVRRTAEDKWFSDCIRLRSNWTCEHCQRAFPGPDLSIHCAHIHGRKHGILRWCADNAVCLCASCHAMFTDAPTDFTFWLESHLGRGHLDLLTEKKRGILKLSKGVRADISKHYREEYRRMEREGTTDLVSWN